MAYRLITNNQTVPILLYTDDTLVQPDGRYYSSGFDTFNSPAALGDLHLMLLGQSLAQDTVLDVTSSTATSIRVDVGTTGQLMTGSAAFLLTSMAVDEFHLDNQGSISAGSLGAVYYVKGDAFISNSGVISAQGGTLGVIALGTHATGNTYSERAYVTNSGTIRQSDLSSGAYAITVQDGLIMQVSNSGLIDGGDTAISGETTLARVLNSGQIVGQVRFENTLDNQTLTQLAVVDNSGQMDTFSTQDVENIFLRNSGEMDAATLQTVTNASVTNTGTISGRVYVSPLGEDITTGTEINFANHGLIATAMDSGKMVDLSAEEIFFINSGEIGGAVDLGVYKSEFSTVVAHNSGTIIGGPSETALTVQAGDDARVTNSGVILGGVEFASASFLFGSASFVNSGEVTNVGGNALFITDLYQDARVFNAGLISGEVLIDADRAELLNAGIIDGDVTLSYSSDSYRATGDGAVTGTVFGRFGDDTLVGGALDDRFDGGAQNDLLNMQGGNDLGMGGDGSDSLYGGDGNDTLTGDAGLDTLFGGNGDDNLAGGADSDRLAGNNGADVVNGGAGNDSIFGGNDDDTLMGGDGDDRLFGGSGVNEFDGGLGRDIFYTQSGEDIIVFRSAADSATGAQRDVVYGFDLGQDSIDLAAAAPGVLTFLGTSAFTGTAREVRLVEYASGSTVMQVDTDANGTSDLELMIYQVQGLTENDFVL
ncbi:calcium-binding protein [Tropicibacter naphthalenivorans]|uniref:Hemolysin, chromosomal n=1 Tax=Tropicibacter naphthalenivorans TaxID=441103 RepID=A0A0P1GMX4_9RHOB|nr:calcium-binding protein [Tropicibacter naphthalenivorans]CUH76669.1 Hemolysin, chromosomal [Tropicibacter naphthalenivorans]SMC64210.1 Hemolysin-type calcium-binding repeat-containing protein [Tropicibacter naphthalenivorans]